ncbi:hypothetical protein E0700_05350 [Lactobacillus helveticus]|nr:hypothetical protein [Lactobacillus helveticus]MBW8037673.1 hypothetical protein [Lactobacillus helveticus]
MRQIAAEMMTAKTGCRLKKLKPCFAVMEAIKPLR